MSEILDLKTIHDYNEFLGLETLNPLVSFVDFSKVEVLKHRCKCFGFYAVFLKEKIHGQITYGRSKYDYQEGTLVFIAPGQVGGINDGGETVHPQGYALLFHPDLIRGTSLAGKMKDYTFFSYEANEALHMSERERQTVFTCFAEIREELGHAIDKHSRSIIVSNIEVLLNHCLRFYDRQFATREAINSTGKTGIAFRCLVCRPASFFCQLFRRPCKEADRQVCYRIHSSCHSQQGERLFVGDGQDGQ